MDIRDLRFIVKVAEVQSISKAAELLFIAQPNLSNIIKRVESEIGIVIFDRTNRGVTITREGNDFLNLSQRIIRQFDKLEQSYISREIDQTRLSLISPRSSYVCLAVIDFCNKEIEQGNNIEVRFREATNYDVISGITSEEYQIGILRPSSINFDYFETLAKSRHLRLTPLPSLNYVILVSESHPLANQNMIDCLDLEQYTEVIHFDYETNMVSIRDFIKDPWDSSKQIRVCDRGSLLDVVSRVKGAYMWTTGTHPSILDQYRLIEIPCNLHSYQSHDMIVYRNDKILSVHEQEFLDILIEQQKRAHAYE